MRRLTSAAALGAVVLLAVPATPASACSVPIPAIDVDRERVARGGQVGVSGEQLGDEDGKHPGCETPVPPVPTPTAVVVAPSESPSPSESPLISLPPLRPVAFEARQVTVTLEEYREWPAPSAKARTIAQVATGSRAPFESDLYTYSFAATVQVPRDVTPGRYVLRAFEPDGVYYGQATITVTSGLAATGSDARLAALALLLLAGAMLVRQQQAHRLGAGGDAVAERPAHR